MRRFTFDTNIMNNTLQYYNTHAVDFTQDTQSTDMSEKYAPFLSRIPSGGHILDLGCGAGRDTKAFLEMGYRVTAVDGSEELCRIASAFTGQMVHQMLFADMAWHKEFDGVWACSSLLHCSLEELPDILQKVSDSLKANGVLYVSFKYGDYAGWRNGRYFTNLTEQTLGKLLEQIPSLRLAETSVTGDVRPGREQELWLNAIVEKI